MLPDRVSSQEKPLTNVLHLGLLSVSICHIDGSLSCILLFRVQGRLSLYCM